MTDAILINIRGQHGRHRAERAKSAGNYVLIGRPSIWGNPYTIGKDGSRKEVVEKYRRYLMSRPDLLAKIPELEGAVLGCWCLPSPCHGEVLLELLGQRQPVLF